MSLRTTTLGLLAVAIAFVSASAIGSATGERSFAQATPAETITVSRDLSLIPSVAPHGALPDLAQRPARPHRRKRRVVHAAPRRGAAAERPAPPAVRVPQPTRPQPRRRPSAPQPDRPDSSSEPPTYEPPPARVSPVPTQVAPVPVEPDPEVEEEEVPEEETAPE